MSEWVGPVGVGIYRDYFDSENKPIRDLKLTINKKSSIELAV